ncbi:hypothetical protein A1O1_08284 [Capronia coronata CBS 617.96]|uniref:Uncharacterized protein n=1 Tax=Capronia coronata CBS 617.96 TaxID=1182541 RepID=W9XHZ1_9EURO|nr:uncharacterized protein A1O1_08284 [Capronia coronata CBS 617.96]EXJ80142.1 hypothetical protein A1O1_08284 [Capronia coronata CBS 617.96]
MPSKRQIQFVDRKGIVYSIGPLGIIRSKRPKAPAPIPTQNNHLSSVYFQEQAPKGTEDLLPVHRGKGSYEVPVVLCDRSYRSPWIMQASWGDEYDDGQVSYDRPRASDADEDNGWAGEQNGRGSTPHDMKMGTGVNHKQHDDSNAPPTQRNHSANLHPRRQHDDTLPPAHHRVRGSAPIDFALAHDRTPLPQITAAGTSPLPFCTAARKLQTTLRRSIAFFKRFYSEFQHETRALGAYADLELINRAWQKKIRNSEQYLTSRSRGRGAMAGTKDQGGSSGDDANSSNNDGNQDQTPRKPSPRDESPFNATVPDLRTFSELQSEVIERVTALYHSDLPQSRLRAPTDKHTLSSHPSNPFDFYTDSEENHGSSPQDRHILEQWNLAIALKRHVHDSYGQLVRVVRLMDKDYMAVTAAARELEMLKRDLEIYRRGWDDNYRSEQDCRDDDQGQGNRSYTDADETAGGGGY